MPCAFNAIPISIIAMHELSVTARYLLIGINITAAGSHRFKMTPYGAPRFLPRRRQKPNKVSS
jgi:hypothetical protein